MTDESYAAWKAALESDPPRPAPAPVDLAAAAAGLQRETLRPKRYGRKRKGKG